MSKRRKFKSKIWWTVGIICGLGLVVFGGYGLLQKYKIIYRPSSMISDKVISYSTLSPDEAKPKCEDYKVAADQPRKITLSSINASGCIQKVGLDQNHSIAVPSNVYLAGWFVHSAVPGKTGVSLIDGHVQGKYEPGIFKNLASLKTGDKIAIEFGDHNIKNFEVVSVTEYSVDEASKKMLEKSAQIESQLNLITCGGRYDTKTHQYERRILVTTKLIE